MDLRKSSSSDHHHHHHHLSTRHAVSSHGNRPTPDHRRHSHHRSRHDSPLLPNRIPRTRQIPHPTPKTHRPRTRPPRPRRRRTRRSPPHYQTNSHLTPRHQNSPLQHQLLHRRQQRLLPRLLLPHNPARRSRILLHQSPTPLLATLRLHHHRQSRFGVDFR